MGQKLIKFYELAKAEGGAMAQMRLAMKTNLPSTKAGEAPDSPENIATFKAAYKEVLGKDAPIN
jgi:hypothetical protein